MYLSLSDFTLWEHALALLVLSFMAALPVGLLVGWVYFMRWLICGRPNE